MAIKQLELVHKIESDKEDKLRVDYVKAENYLRDNQEKLNGLSKFRFDYMKQLQEKGFSGLSGSNYGHFQAFIAKIESAMTQQVQTINTAKEVVIQRKDLWLKQQIKTKAIEKLLEKQKLVIHTKLLKNEQKLLDEHTSNLFSRNQKSGMFFN